VLHLKNSSHLSLDTIIILFLQVFAVVNDSISPKGTCFIALSCEGIDQTTLIFYSLKLY
jgi:hypothetical protein